MHSMLAGLFVGLAYAAIDVSLYVPLEPERRRTRWVVLGALAVARLLVALLLAVTALGLPRWLAGTLLGAAISLPFAPLREDFPGVLVVGASGGLAVGIALGAVV